MIKDISPQNLSYIIGFLQGDGSHQESSRNRGKISIEISNRDIDILDKIENILSPLVKVNRSFRIRSTNFKDDCEFCCLTIHNIDFRTSFKQFVPVGCKSNLIKPPIELSDFSKRDYIRGLIDSDGSIGLTSENKPYISLCTDSEDITRFIVNSIEEVTGAVKRINRNERDGVFNITLFNEDAVTYAKYLYESSNLYLNRKYLKYLEICEWVRLAPKRVGRPKKWLASEDELILDNSISLEEKSELLKRSKNSIKTRLWRLEAKVTNRITS